MKKITRYKITIGAVAILLLAGCASIGPRTIPRDRFDYASAISTSWKKQMLLNMVKIRYADIPVFVDVASVINQYALEGEITLGASWSDGINGDGQNVGGTGKYRDQPTITYAPLMGKRFAESLVKPIPPPAIFFLIQTGIRVDGVFRTCVQTVNGIHNRTGRHSMVRPADPEFYRLISLLRKIQQSGAVGMRIEKTEDEREATVFTFKQKNISPEIVSAINSVKLLLGLSPDVRDFRVVYGSVARDDKEIAILSRSMLEVIIELSSYVDVPEMHLTEGRTYEALLDQMDVSEEFGPLIAVNSDESRPADDFIAVRYKDYWFWIDDRDLRSKRTFAFLWLLFSFTETEKGYAPVVTIPTG
ncbi:MAG: hypothetical protein PVF76_06815 [Syntrophobacterales bacterium]|jgi:hypothetical protein